MQLIKFELFINDDFLFKNMEVHYTILIPGKNII